MGGWSEHRGEDADAPPPRLAAWEVVGAWLRVWTPPRGARVPPVPWEALLAAVAVLAVAGVVIAGEVREGRDRAQAREAAARAERAERRRGAQAYEQRATLLSLAGAPDVAAIERAISREARRRHAAGELVRRPGATRCRPGPEEDLAAPKVVLECLTATGRVLQPGTPAGTIGYPFRAVVDRPARRVAFCATNPIPGERVAPDPEDLVRLPAPCRDPDA